MLEPLDEESETESEVRSEKDEDDDDSCPETWIVTCFFDLAELRSGAPATSTAAAKVNLVSRDGAVCRVSRDRFTETDTQLTSVSREERETSVCRALSRKRYCDRASVPRWDPQVCAVTRSAAEYPVAAESTVAVVPVEAADAPVTLRVVRRADWALTRADRLFRLLRDALAAPSRAPDPSLSPALSSTSADTAPH